MYESVFQANHAKVWSHVFDVELHVTDLTGGFPLSGEDVIAGWLKSKIADPDELLQAAIAENMVASAETAAVMAEAEIKTPEQAVAALAKSKSLKGFKRDADGLYIEGRQVKACVKEAISIAAQGAHIDEKGWGKATNKKWIKAFGAEHIQVPEIRIHVSGATPGQADEVRFDFVHASGNHGFKQSEVIWDAAVAFTVETDYDFDSPKVFWPSVWSIAEQQGLGADRSQGQGRFVVTRWEKRK